MLNMHEYETLTTRKLHPRHQIHMLCLALPALTSDKLLVQEMNSGRLEGTMNFGHEGLQEISKEGLKQQFEKLVVSYHTRQLSALATHPQF